MANPTATIALAPVATPASITQTFLPVINPKTKMVLGMIPIASTTFAGTETTFTIQGDTVPIGIWNEKYTSGLPYGDFPVSKNAKTTARHSIGPFMAFLPTEIMMNRNSYQNYGTFVPLSAVLPARYITANSIGVQEINVLGALIFALSYNLSVFSAPAAPAAPTVTTPASLTWTSTAPFVNATVGKFFEFNWIDLFKASFPTTQPAFITVTSNPASSNLFAVPVQGQQVIQNTLNNNTIRIVSTGVITAGTYAFVFSIGDRNGNVVSVTLNLTVN